MFEITLAEYFRNHDGLKLLTSDIYAIKLPKISLAPAIRVTMISAGSEEGFEGRSSDNAGLFQVDIWSTDTSDLILLIKELKDALDNIGVLGITTFDLREQPSQNPDETILKRTFEFTINYTE